MKMPVSTMQRSPHLTELENGLKSLKASKLRSRQEFETMYGLIEKHHRDLKLGYLTGMPPDRRKQAEQDCKFYYILAKMLGEIECGGEAEKETALSQVYRWYEDNRKVLHTGPRFGRAKRKASRDSRPGSRRDDDRSTRPSTAGSSGVSSRGRAPPRSASSLSQVSSAKTRKPNEPSCQPTAKQTLPGEDGSPRPVSPSEVSAATQYYYQQYGAGHIEDVGLTQPQEEDLPPSDPDTRRPYSAPTPQHDHRPQSSFSEDSTQAPTPDVAMRGRRPGTAASESVLLPRRKPLPLPHVFNPLSKAFEATVELPTSGPPTERTTGSGRFQLSSRGGSVYQDQSGGVISLRMTHLQKWGTFQQNQSMGQDMLAKLQHVGRAGVPGSTRYAAHEHGLTTEDMTQHVIANYALIDEYNKSQQGPAPTSDRRNLMDKPLEEFYESTEPYYPVKRNKYPSFRGKSAPPGGKAQRHGSDKDNLGCGSSDGGSGRESSLKLDTLVNMIDTVTDEMTCHKEKVAPDPLPGFRQPTVYVEQGSRPQTAPPGARARPTTPDNRDARSESHMYTQLAPGREQLLLRPATEGATPGRVHPDMAGRGQSPLQPTAMELVDWRGKVTPDSARTKWSQSFGSHSFVQKMSRPKSSLRSGSTGGGTSRRPKTSGTTTSAPANRTTTIEETVPWSPELLAADNRRPAVAASHTTTEVDSDVVSSLLTTTKFNSAKMRTRPEIQEDEDDLDFLMYLNDSRRMGDGRQTTSTTPNKAYLTFCTSMKGTQDMRTSLDDKPVQIMNRTHESETASSSKMPAPAAPAVTPRAPILTDTSKFLEEVQRLVANGALEEQDGDESRLNTARSAPGEMSLAVGGDEAPLEETTKEEEEPGRRRQLTFLVDDTKVVPGEEEEVEDDPGAAEGANMTTQGDFGLSSDEAAIMSLDVNQYLKNYANASKGAPGGGTSTSKLSAGYKHRVFQRSFPRQQPPPATPQPPTDDTPGQDDKDDVGGLTIEGQGARTQDKRKVRDAQGTSGTKGSKANRGEKGASAPKRSAGVVPARAKSANPLRVLQKQSEMLKNSPVEPYRTPPSIPTPWSQFGTRTQRPPAPSTVYMAELEAQSRKMNRPKDYVEKAKFDASRNMLLTELRRPPTDNEENVPRLPPPAEMTEQERQLVAPLKVFRMKHEDGTPIIISCEPRPGRGGPAAVHSHGQGSHADGDQSCAACVQEGGHPGPTGEYMGQRLLDMGRPIPQYLPACDPVEVAAAAQRLKEAQAAVDIQRIFRGYVARNQYKYLLKEERQTREDHQKAAIEIQRRMRGHLSRKRAIYNRRANSETLIWARDYREQLRDRERHRKVKVFVDQEKIGKKNAENAAKLSIIGPHVDVYEPFHPKKTGPDRALINRASIIIQKVARGWLIRHQMDRLRRKAKYHSSSWSKFMTTYRELLRRLQLRAGIDKPRAPFDFRDINEYMDLKKRYESVFDKRAFGGEMEHEELPAYFKECDLYPAKSEVEEAISSVFRGQIIKKNRGLFKQEVLEITFQIYPLKGTGLQSNRKSTWLNPIVDGEEAVKLSGTDNVEATDFKTCWKLVSGVAKERRVEDARTKREAEEEEERQEDQRRQALKAKSKQEKKVALPAENTTKTKTSQEQAAPPEVTSPEEPEIKDAEKNTGVAVPEEQQEDPPVEAAAEGSTGPTLEEKSFIEQKLEKIENEAPGWVPAKSEQQRQQQVEIVLNNNLDTITEVTETELKLNPNGAKRISPEP